MKIDQVTFLESAEHCRRSALTYLGLPEAAFLLSAAKAFEDLADGSIMVAGRDRPDLTTGQSSAL
jgi:hypothetical protein